MIEKPNDFKFDTKGNVLVWLKMAHVLGLLKSLNIPPDMRLLQNMPEKELDRYFQELNANLPLAIQLRNTET